MIIQRRLLSENLEFKKLQIAHTKIPGQAVHRSLSWVLTHFGPRSVAVFRVTTLPRVILSNAKKLPFRDHGLNPPVTPN